MALDRERYLDLIRSERRGPLAWLARRVLGLASGPYALAVRGRNLAFDRGWKEVQRASVPVVSVGNLTLGGTGKTPMVEWVARWFRTRGLRVTLISRGYGGTEGLNDEGRVLDQNLPDVPHLQDPDRVELARIAVEELEAQVLVLDDGFQHRRLGRDLDIVLLDALDPFGTGRLFPRGLLREPLSALKRADVVVLSRADLVPLEARAAIRARAEKVLGPLRWVEARHAPLDLIDAEGRSESLETLSSRTISAFCGIGNPGGFQKTLEQIGVRPIALRRFPDHHPYPRADVFDLANALKAEGAELALTTQKDLVKLRTLELGGVPLRALRIGLELLEGQDVLDAALTQVVEKI